jgi:hypothetical protein
MCVRVCVRVCVCACVHACLRARIADVICGVCGPALWFGGHLLSQHGVLGQALDALQVEALSFGRLGFRVWGLGCGFRL